MIYVFGADPFQKSPSSMSLFKYLVDAGFKPKEINHAPDSRSISSDSYCLSFGSDSFKELTGCEESLTEWHGSLFDKHDDPSVFVFPFFSPGYLYYNKHLTGQFTADLEAVRCLIQFDQGVAP